MKLRSIALLLAACGIGANLFAELPNRDRDRDLDARGHRHHAKAAGDAEQDDATARRAFMREWYGEWTPEYRKFMLRAAAVERQRYSDKMPSVYGQHLMGLAAAGSSWVNLGPTNADSETNGSTLFVRDSGRPVSIVVDPTNASIIYNATAEGGVWKTTNGGTSWTPITETLGSLSCGWLAMDPNNSSTLYLGLGDSFNGTGIGLVKSTDGGATWSAPVFLGASTMIRDLKVSSTNSQVVLAATNMGFFRSTDGGATWAKVAIATGATGDPSCWSIAWGGGTNWALSLESNTTVTTGSGQIWASSDDGATWTQSTGFNQATVGVTRSTLASAPSQPSIMYAYAAGSKSWSTSDAGQDLADFYRSTDGGRTWSAFGVGGSSTQYTNSNSDSTYVRNVLGGQAWYNQMLIVDPSNPATVYAGGNLALIMITNASSAPSYSVMSNWLAQYSLPYVHADFHAGTIDRNGTMYMGTDGGIFKQTSAASNTWTSDLNIGIVSHLIYSVGSSLNNRNAIIGGFQDNGTRVRSGSSSTFNQQIGGDGFGTHLNAANASNMLGSLYYARVYKSTDGGATFASASTGITESNNSSSAPFATRIVPGLADATGNTVYTFSNLNVYQSTDYAGSWSALTAAPITTGAIRGIGVAKSNGSVMGVVCSGGRVFLSANGGSSWTAPAALPNTGNYMSYIWFDTNNSSVVYVASVAPDSTKTHLWKSSNSGGAWTAIDGSGFPAGVPVNAIQNDPGDSNTLYAGTNLGVYKSTDGGSTWTRFGTGLPLVDVTDFYLAPDSSLMRASTFGRGFWELTNTAPANTVTASITTPASNVTIASGTAQSFVGAGTDSSSTATLSYAWAFGDGVSGTGASTSHTYTNTGTTAATYTATLTVTDNTGVSSTATRAITVNPPAANTVTASITTPASDVTIASGTAQSFAGTSTDSSSTATLSYAWTFGDGGTATGASASHTYTNTGTAAATYTATLKVTDNTGVSNTATRAITVSPATGGTTTTQVFGNPGFETGTASPWVTTSGVLDNGTSEPAHSGSWKAWLCGYGSSHTDTVMQQVAIPANATAASLSFWLHIDTAETSGTHDTLAVQVRNSAGTVLGTLATYSNLNANTGYSQVSFDLSAYKGQTIQINLVGTEDATNQTSFVVDDFALNVTTPASTPSNTVTASITTPASNVTVASGTAQSFAGTATDSSSAATLTYAWNFGDGSTATGATASHTYTNTGTAAATYTATFTATDNTGVSSSATRAITVNPAGGSGGTELVTNGGFESGTTAWSGTTADIGTFTGEPAHTGTKNCWLLGNGRTATEYIQQQAFTVPAAGATLTFWLHIDTAETTTTNAYDTLQVQVLNSAGTVLGTLATYSNLNAASGYTQRNFSLAAYAGQTITLKFLGNEDASLQTSFVLDDVSAK